MLPSQEGSRPAGPAAQHLHQDDLAQTTRQLRQPRAGGGPSGAAAAAAAHDGLAAQSPRRPAVQIQRFKVPGGSPRASPSREFSAPPPWNSSSSSPCQAAAASSPCCFPWLPARLRKDSLWMLMSTVPLLVLMVALRVPAGPAVAMARLLSRDCAAAVAAAAPAAARALAPRLLLHAADAAPAAAPLAEHHPAPADGPYGSAAATVAAGAAVRCAGRCLLLLACPPFHPCARQKRPAHPCLPTLLLPQTPRL